MGLVGRYIPQRLKMSANPEESQMCGYLKLRTWGGGKWKSSWWVLKDNVMFRFNAAEDIVAQETLLSQAGDSRLSLIKTSSCTRECRPVWCSSCPTQPWRRWCSALR